MGAVPPQAPDHNAGLVPPFEAPDFDLDLLFEDIPAPEPVNEQDVIILD
jgi:hypothetical protein